MLQKLNERIHGVVAWVIISLVAVTFTLFGVDYYLQSHHDSSAQVEVNGQVITKRAFDLNYRRTRQMRDPSLMTALLENQLKQQVMDEMVVNSVSMQAARSNGFDVTTTEANSAILGIAQFQQDGHFSTDRYQQVLNGAFYTPESFQKEVIQGMLLNQQRFSFIGTSFALPNEIEQFVKLYMQTRDYDYLQIPMQQFLKPTEVSAEDIKRYYQKHPNDFVTPEQISVDFVTLSMADVKKNMTLPESQIKHYYNDNLANYRTPAQWKVAHILFSVSPTASADELARIQKKAEETALDLQKNPDQFEQQALTVSDDKISATKGGALPWIIAGQTEFDASLLALTTPGQISGPIKSLHGYEIFKILAYKPSIIKPFIDVQAEIKNQLIADLAQAEYAQRLEKLSDLSYQTPDSLDPVAQALNVTVQESPLFTRQGGNTEFTQNKQVIHAAFNNDVLALGNNSEPVQLNNESVVVLRINKHLPSKQKTLSEVQSVIQEKLAIYKARQQAKQLGQALLTQNDESSDKNTWLTDHHVVWKSIEKAARDTDLVAQPINEFAFGLSKVGAQMGQGLAASGDYVIVRLKAIHEGRKETLDKEQVASITQQLEANFGMMDYDLYVSDLMSKAVVIKH